MNRTFNRNSPPPLVTLSSTPAPSRRREEAVAMANIRKKVAPSLLRLPWKKTFPSCNVLIEEEKREEKGPTLFQKILSTKPVSMVVELNEMCTAWQDSDFITDCLCWHNVYRQRHGAIALLMSTQLCDYAQNWANNLAHTNKFRYRNNKNVGQNLYQRPVTDFQSDVTGQEVSSYWYGAVRRYNYFNEPDVLNANVNAGHFTQMVWSSTCYFGVGKARSRAGKVIVVANYSPPGNIFGKFEQNVLPPLPENSPELICPPNI